MLILSVTQINRYISFKFKDDKKLSGVMIKGEISNFTAHRSGHFYFTLKDKESSIKAVMFKSHAVNVKFMPENGMNVIAMGNISVFERDGIYQVYVTDIVPDGIGSVYVASEQLKAKLQKEGIFDQSAKRPIPQMPVKIGVVTSKTGAALQDIINILSRRYPIGELVLVPALVQGEGAADSISKALIQAGKFDCDVIILARGGGSLEDLTPFNTEKVAYAVYNSSVPVISAVGHETDVTIADLAADLRAPTPSAAAEVVSVSKEQLNGNLNYYNEKLKNLIRIKLNNAEASLERLTERLIRFSPQFKIENNIRKFDDLQKRLDFAFIKIISDYENKYISRISQMEALSPIKVLKRGYSLIYKNSNIISNISKLECGDIIEIKMSDGTVKAKIITEEDI
ncbi:MULTISPECIES: exodeoxyribonuclease VII large subunit [Porcipelethomonas]|uniref:exodeoxyribonuclease VII large subunit n=1 Tax=Porcipelethomonas TaxID=2981643 RepID=UPI0008217007|nr:exodeoxyribonuclease VII large subunit [Porcipelethomonas ammoniilytica]MCU6718484.1 exodeoxyribonuclease VII large subunit [Porcipelethomonas ammoniilytica]SCI51942.1 Exodeoxyribonuclease 7 large subunit [uncultured Ruminococcus sp.]